MSESGAAGLHDAPSADRRHGGEGESVIQVLQLITSTRPFFEEQVSALEDRGIECTVVGVPGSYAPEAPRSPADYLRYYPTVLRRSLDAFDLVHANYGLMAPFALAQPRRPVVVTLWGTDLMGEHGWLRRLSVTGGRMADAVVLPSEAMAAAYPHDHERIPFGVDTERFRPIDRTTARERLGWPDEPTVLFPYDPDRPEKDYERAERVVERADTDVRLHTVTGVDHDEMPTVYNASDALLVTSRREAGPMAVKEAAACNVPVVSTDVGFVAEVIEGVSNSAVRDTDAGLADALDRTVAAGRSDGRGTVDCLGVDEMGERLAALYGRVLA